MEYSAHEGDEKYFKFLIWNPEGIRPFGRRVYTWKGYTETDVNETRLAGVDWIRSVQD